MNTAGCSRTLGKWLYWCLGQRDTWGVWAGRFSRSLGHKEWQLWVGQGSYHLSTNSITIADLWFRALVVSSGTMQLWHGIISSHLRLFFADSQRLSWCDILSVLLNIYTPRQYQSMTSSELWILRVPRQIHENTQCFLQWRETPDCHTWPQEMTVHAISQMHCCGASRCVWVACVRTLFKALCREGICSLLWPHGEVSPVKL